MVYRSDIDGLRALAVCIVIFFHFGIPGFSGGFIGVDVFFVLSGYLIGSIILNQLHKDTFSFLRFYFRRIRRLFPVFVVVIVATTIAAYSIMLPNDFREFGQSVIASSVYLSNILFYMEAGYFDTASHLKPLLHTWSLSVEEQFYIVFPVLAWLIYRLKKAWLFPIFLILTISSLLAAELYLDQNTSAVFYLYPFRAWEMFIGVCLATQYLPKIQSPRIGLAFSIAGLAMIVLPSILYTDKTPFPGFTAFIPCLGTCLLIYSGSSQQSFIHRLLMTRIPVFLGKISYSLYLWHWPVYVLYMYDKTSDAGALDILKMGSLTLAAAFLSWKYIETPFREGRAPFSQTILPAFTATALSSLILIGAGYYFHKTNGVPERLDERTASFARAANDLFGDLSSCEEENNQTLADISYCTIGKPFTSENYTLIWGDSHGGAYKRGYEEAINKKEHSALLAWTGGCPPVFNIDKDESVSSRVIDQQCAKRNQAIRELIENDSRINAIILVGRWSYYLNGEGVGVDQHNKITVWPENGNPDDSQPQDDFFVKTFNKTILQLQNSGHKVFVVEQSPEFSQYQARIVALGLMGGDKNITNAFNDLTSEDYVNVNKRQNKIQQALKQAHNDGVITLLKTHDFFCKEEKCSLILDGSPAYFDNNHLSSAGAVKISSMFEPVLQYLNRLP